MARPQAVRTRTGRRVPALGSLAGVLLLLAAAVAAPAQAAPGDLDLTFSGDGKQTTDFGLGFASAAATVRQPDGQIVAVGTDRAHGEGVFALARYNPDGSIDTSFSGDGKQRTEFDAGVNAGIEGATAVALQSDGKIVAVGGGSGDFLLARYNPDGSLDPSFSGDGKQTTDLGPDDRAGGVVIQADGKIVVAGFVGDGNGTPIDFALVRYNANGSLDTTFSGDGKQTTDFGGFDEAKGVTLQANGKIVAVGRGGGGNDFAFARYNANGGLDTSFSGDGKQTTDFGGSEGATGVAILGTGKIVAVGSENTTSADFLLARYNANGSLDTTFSGDGKQTTDFGGTDKATGVTLPGTGKIVAVGFVGSGSNTPNDFALARYNSDGSLDTSFSGDGRQTTDIGGRDGANGVALQDDGKMLAVGAAQGPGGNDFALARYNSDGSLDTSFSGDGKQRTGFGGYNNVAKGVALQADGKIVAVGRAGPNFNLGLARYNPNGTLDPSFSGDGKRTTGFDANGVAIQPNGKIVVVGGVTVFAIARYNSDGSLDTSFSGDGVQTTDFGGFGAGAAAVAIQGDGKIVAVGSATTIDFQDRFAIARYNPDGSPDTSFSGDGKQITQGGEFNFWSGVALQADGKIVAVGGSDGDFALARYNPDGSLDPSFSGGLQFTDFGSTVGGAAGVAIQANGRIVAVGAGGAGGEFALARYTTNGSLDTSFSGDGKQTTDFGGFDAATAVALQGDGKIVAVGGTSNFPSGDFAFARYNPNGSLDTTFSGDGKQTTNFGGRDEANGVAVQPDGNIVAVGVGRGPKQNDNFALARYLGS